MVELVLDSTKKRISIQYESVINHDTPIYSTTIASNFHLYDMVISQNQPGCIVHLTSATARLLYIDNTTQVVNVANLQPRVLPRNAKQLAYDCNSTVLQVDDLVIPLSWDQLQDRNRGKSSTSTTIAVGNSELYAGTICRVKHILQSKLFLHNDSIKAMYGGMFVVDASTVQKFST
uniref:Uncharacterized protein n=1 Tax=Lygus hesperus TaxID=30085 RepID=A0A146LFG2_LYGHE